MATRLELHQKVGAIADAIESEFSSTLCQSELLTVEEFVRSGSLHYWLCNFLDVLYARWEVACEKETPVANSIETESEKVPICSALRSMSLINQASQDFEWNLKVRAQFDAYRAEYGSLQRELIVENVATTGSEMRSSVTSQEITTRRRWHTVRLSQTYLPRAAELFLAASLGSLPVRWQEPTIRSKSLDLNLRGQLDFHPESALPGSFEHFARSYLPHHLPMSLVEDFREIQLAVSKKMTPTPKAFFTAHLHVSSDSFLIWAAINKKFGICLLLSQHGGLNGQGAVPTRGEEFEQLYADRYLNWGWSTAQNAVTIPTQLNIWAKKRRRSNDLKKLILITDCTYRLSRRPWGNTGDNTRYRNLLLDSYEALDIQVRSNTTVRLHHDHDKYDQSHEFMWRSAFPDVDLDLGRSSIWKLRHKARLVVCTSLGTSEIEQFARNIPTILRLDPEVHALRSPCVALFTAMEDVGLVHWSVGSFSEFLIKNWNDIDSWWNSQETKQVVADYLSLFSNFSDRPVRELRRILLASVTKGCE